MAEVEATEIGERTFRVDVHGDGSSTTHRVTVPEGYPEELGLVDVDLGTLVERSFAFLLDREPKESILAEFELRVIERYFPDYPDQVPGYIDA